MTAADQTWPDPRVGLPPELVVPGIRAEIRRAHRRSGRRIVVLDDDPTGSQSVHGVDVTLVLDAEACAATVPEPGNTGFVLTNSRSLAEREAAALARRLGAQVHGLEPDLGGPVEVVSRSDSCLRGHVLAEVDALAAASAEVAGRRVDAVLFVPALLGAGRFTVDGVHWAVVDGMPRPVGTTEFARDATFGYTASALPDFLAERSGGAVPAASVRAIGIEDIRTGGPQRVAELLLAARDRTWVVVDAVSEHDLDVVARGVTLAQEQGSTFLYRTGPSFVRALAGIEPRTPLRPDEVACPAAGAGHGLVVVGSHTAATTAQLDRLLAGGNLLRVDLDVTRLLDDDAREACLAEAADLVATGLARSDVVLATSRTVAAATVQRSALEVAASVSAALVTVVQRVRTARPSWVVGKGGITSHDVALGGLGITRAEVVGQFATPGISLFRPRTAAACVGDMPYVVFPGNVGGPEALAEVVAVLREAAHLSIRTPQEEQQP